jgi:hypothetical protein
MRSEMLTADLEDHCSSDRGVRKPMYSCQMDMPLWTVGCEVSLGGSDRTL